MRKRTTTWGLSGTELMIRDLSGVDMKAKKPPLLEHQQLLLGIGLSVAIIALVSTIGMSFYSLSKPPEQVTPKIRTLEDKQGARIIVVGE